MKRCLIGLQLSSVLFVAIALAGCGKDPESAASDSGQKPAATGDASSRGAGRESEQPVLEIELGELTTPSGFGPYQIRPPAGFWPSRAKDRGISNATAFQWRGEHYELNDGVLSVPHFLVIVGRDSSGSITPEQEIKRRLEMRVDSKPGEVTSITIDGIEFQRCGYDVDNDKFGPGRGFVYAGVDDGTVIVMMSTQFEPGGYHHLDVADASARSFQRNTDAPALREVETAETPEQTAAAPRTPKRDEQAGASEAVTPQPALPEADAGLTTRADPQPKDTASTVEEIGDAPTSALEDGIRTWQDATGKFTIEAEMVGYGPVGVTLKKVDGKEITLPMARLSEADQEWVRNHTGG